MKFCLDMAFQILFCLKNSQFCGRLICEIFMYVVAGRICMPFLYVLYNVHTYNTTCEIFRRRT